MHCDFTEVRIAAVKCVASNILPFIELVILCLAERGGGGWCLTEVAVCFSVHEVAHQLHKQGIQDFIYSVLSKLVCVGIVDPSRSFNIDFTLVALWTFTHPSTQFKYWKSVPVISLLCPFSEAEVRLCVMKALTNVHPMVHRALASPKIMDMVWSSFLSDPAKK